MAISRRTFLRSGLTVGAGLVVASRYGWPSALAQVAQTPLPGSAIPQFVDPLPLLDLQGGPIQTVLDDEATLRMREFRANVMPSTFLPGTYQGTWVWGYRTGSQPTAPVGSYIGPVIVGRRGIPTEITYVNELGDTTGSQVRAWVDATDQTLHWADPLGTGHSMAHYDGPIPAVPHLHGGEVPPVLDGGPDSWWTSDGDYFGHAFYTGAGGAANAAVYRYPNSQEAAPIWFHDHVLGATRLNVYAGLAGAYPIVDPEMPLPDGLAPLGLQRGEQTDLLIPLVIQDRMFDTTGQLFFPNIGLNPEHPYWVPEFEGDTIVVNGKVWPHLVVEPKRYRFLFLNGANARAFEMFLTNPVTKVNGPAMWQIATDGGYLNAPVRIDPNAPKGQMQRLLLLPGERAEVIIDFAGFAGQTLNLRNVARHPFPQGVTPNGNTLGRVLQFRVSAGAVPADSSFDPAQPGVTIRGGAGQAAAIPALVNPTTGVLNVTPDRTRLLTLNEWMGPGGPLAALVNNTMWDGRRTDGTVRTDFTPVTAGGVTEYFSELPEEGSTELWEVVNLTADAHPIHTHLTQVQVVNRQNFNVNRYNGAYNAAFPGGVYMPGDGPPLAYAPATPGGKYGGNPDVAPFLQGPARPPDANEAGWKDTVTMYPGQVTRIAVRYAPTDVPVGTAGAYPFDPDAKAAPGDPDGHGYVWHCHIVDHEDNEMMRPLRVQPKSISREYKQGTDY